MKFFDWLNAKKPEFKLDEKTSRAGIMNWAYPDGYVRSHYPAPYFMPVAADAMQKMGDKVDDDKVDHGQFVYKHHERMK